MESFPETRSRVRRELERNTGNLEGEPRVWKIASTLLGSGMRKTTAARRRLINRNFSMDGTKKIWNLSFEWYTNVKICMIKLRLTYLRNSIRQFSFVETRRGITRRYCATRGCLRVQFTVDEGRRFGWSRPETRFQDSRCLTEYRCVTNSLCSQGR